MTKKLYVKKKLNSSFFFLHKFYYKNKFSILFISLTHLSVKTSIELSEVIRISSSIRIPIPRNSNGTSDRSAAI